MKPEEMDGNDREARVRYLLSWFGRYFFGKASPKWLYEHIFELCYFVATEPPMNGRKWRHKKRGSVYTELGRGRLQISGSEFDDKPCVIYRAEDGSLWARLEAEFMDGRFAELGRKKYRIREDKLDLGKPREWYPVGICTEREVTDNGTVLVIDENGRLWGITADYAPLFEEISG